MRTRTTLLAILAFTVFGVSFTAQAPAFKRDIVQRGDLSTAGKEAIMAVAEFNPGADTGLHTHPGEEISYVLEGTLVLEVEGRGLVTLKAGDSFLVEAGKVHGAANKGGSVTRVVSTYIVAKGQPLATPAR